MLNEGKCFTMSLFNEERERLLKIHNQKILKEESNLDRRIKYVSRVLITEDTYTDIIADNIMVTKAYQSMQPDKWSIPMSNFVSVLDDYNNDRDGSAIHHLIIALYRIPMENTEERLTAALEYFKSIIIKGNAMEFSDGALKFLTNTIELFLKSHPNPKAISIFVEKIDFIKEIVANSNINTTPKIMNLIKLLDQLVYRFIDYGYQQAKSERLGNFSENIVAQIAPIVNNTGVMMNSDNLNIDELVPKDCIEEACWLFIDEGFDNIEDELVNEGMVQATYNKISHFTRHAVDKGDRAWEKVKGKFTNAEKRTSEALKDTSFLDQKLSYLFKAAIVTGATIVTLGNYAGVVAAIVMMSRYDKLKDSERKRLIPRLEEELVIINEKITDYSNEGNKEMKYALIRLKMKLEKAINLLKAGKSANLGADGDLKGFTIDEKRLLRKQKKEKARQEKIGRHEDESENEYDD